MRLLESIAHVGFTVGGGNGVGETTSDRIKLSGSIFREKSRPCMKFDEEKLENRSLLRGRSLVRKVHAVTVAAFEARAIRESLRYPRANTRTAEETEEGEQQGKKPGWRRNGDEGSTQRRGKEQ